MTRRNALALLLFVAATSCGRPKDDMGAFETVKYGGTAVNLRGQSGLILTLQKDATAFVQWAPDDYRALDLEVRAQIVDFAPADIHAPPVIAPLVTFFARIGHGKNTVQLPFVPGLQNELAAFSGGYTLPARGMVQRINARELQLGFRSPTKVDGSAAYDTTKVAISFQPTQSMASNSMPIQIDGLPGQIVHPFPVEAREWRLADPQGRPFAAAAASFIIFGMGGNVILAAGDAADWAQFRPLPVQGFAWGSALSRIQATFR